MLRNQVFLICGQCIWRKKKRESLDNFWLPEKPKILCLTVPELFQISIFFKSKTWFLRNKEYAWRTSEVMLVLLVSSCWNCKKLTELDFFQIFFFLRLFIFIPNSEWFGKVLMECRLLLCMFFCFTLKALNLFHPAVRNCL